MKPPFIPPSENLIQDNEIRKMESLNRSILEEIQVK